MPELPEVETIRIGLEKLLVGDIVSNVEVRLEKMLVGETSHITGSKIMGVRRFGKGLVVDFQNGNSLAIHIKMTGQLIYVGERSPKGSIPNPLKVGATLPNSYTHVIFKLKSKGGILYYNDIRQFGWMRVIKTAELKSIPFFRDLGPEPLTDLTLEHFQKVLAKTHGPIKPMLLDQKKIGGIGNIYANDALFLARIHPTRKANSLNVDEVENLYNSVHTVLKKGLEVGGASEWQYVNALGETGQYQNFFQVYGKVGKECVICGSKIEKITMGGRGTFYCPSCQR